MALEIRRNIDLQVLKQARRLKASLDTLCYNGEPATASKDGKILSG